LIEVRGRTRIWTLGITFRCLRQTRVNSTQHLNFELGLHVEYFDMHYSVYKFTLNLIIADTRHATFGDAD